MRTQRSWRPRATNLGKISPNRSSRKVMKTVCTKKFTTVLLNVTTSLMA